MTIDNLYKHNARSYYDVYTPLVAAYPRKPTWLFKEIAGMFDHQSELMNRIATDILYPQTRESAYAFAATCDYDPTEADGASDTLTLTLGSAMAKTLPIDSTFRGISTATGSMVDYETTEVGDSGGTDTITVTAKQKKSYSSILIATIEDNDDFRDYPIDGYTDIIKDSMELTIDALTWTRVSYFDDSDSTDKHFQLVFQSSGKVRIRFGDGVTGLKPTIGDGVYADFEVTKGLTGKMDTGEIDINASGDSDVIEVTNAGSSGGNDSETIASILRNARGSVRLRDIIWSQEDLEIAARSSSSSVQKALGIPGSGAASIHIVPSGGGVPGAGLLTDVENYVQPLTQFGAMPITGVAPNYVSVSPTATVTTRTGFVQAKVEDLVEFALTLTTSAIDNQVIEYYDDNGIDSTRTDIINTLWALAFVEADNAALASIIDKWKVLLGDRDYREWGQDLEVGDLWIMGNSLYDFGADLFALSAPAANVSAASDEIISIGTVTVA